jgi:hypothetical protein
MLNFVEDDRGTVLLQKPTGVGGGSCTDVVGLERHVIVAVREEPLEGPWKVIRGHDV